MVTYKCRNDFELCETWKKYDGGRARTFAEMSQSEANMLGLGWRPGVSSLIASRHSTLKDNQYRFSTGPWNGTWLLSFISFETGKFPLTRSGVPITGLSKEIARVWGMEFLMIPV